MIPHPPQPVAVLYLDTRLANLLTMQMLFRLRPQYVLRTASFIGEALRLARRHERTGLLLIDPEAAEGGAEEVLAALRGVPGYEHTPAIALTADGGFDASRAGFEESWTKPVQPRAVLPRLDAWLAPQPEGGTAERPAGSLHRGPERLPVTL